VRGLIMKKIPFLTVLFVFVFSCMCLAAEYPYIYKGFRPMGMGGAFVAVSNDANALFYNPAGLADIDSIRASIFGLEIEMGKNTVSVLKDALDTDFGNESESAQFIRDHMGDRSHLGLAIVPNYSMPRFAVTVIGTGRMDLDVRDRQYPKLDVNVINDIGLGAGYAHPFLEDSLLIGASAKYIHRQSLAQEYTVADLSDKLSDRIRDDLKKGNGILVDLGIIYKLSKVQFANTRVGISANNLIGGGLGDAADATQHVDIGFAQDLDLKVTKATFAIDYVDLFNQFKQDSDIAKRLRLGAECRFLDIIFVRAGLYQGYLTAGLNLEARVVRLDLLTYAEEVGAYAGQRVDRRYAGRFVFGF
jgi:hypothetical protein